MFKALWRFGFCTHYHSLKRVITNGKNGLDGPDYHWVKLFKIGKLAVYWRYK